MAGAGSTKPSFLIEFVGYVVIGLPLCGIVAAHAGALGGLRALWLAVLATHVVVAALYVVWFRRGRWADPRSLR